MHQIIIAQILRSMGVSLPQQKFILELLNGTWLSVRGRFNFTNLSRYCSLHERTLRRGFARGVAWGRFNALLLAEIISPDHEVIAVMDATFIPKSGKKTPGLSYFFHGTAGRVEKGLELKLLSVVDVTANTAYALDARQTIPCQATGAKKKKADMADESRMAEHLRHLRETRHLLPEQVRYLAADGYYACHDFVKGVCKLELAMVSKLRHNADMRYLYNGKRNPKGRPRLYAGKVQWAQPDFRRWRYEGEIEKGVRLYSAKLYHVTLKRVIKVAMLLTTQGGKTHRVLLFCTDITLDGMQIVHYYKARFQIEFLFRDAKQGTGLCDCQARSKQALEFHWNAALCAVNLAKWKQHERLGKGRFSLASSMHRCANERFVEILSSALHLDLKAIKSQPGYEAACNYGVLCP